VLGKVLLMPAPEATLFQLLNRSLLLFLPPVLVAAPVFIALKFLRYEAISQSQADQIIAWVKLVLPVIALQYSSTVEVDPIGSRYYALLLVVALVMVAIMFFYCIYKYCMARKYMPMPARREYALCIFAPLMYFFVAWFDFPNSGTVHGFRADSIGLYYFRQYVLIVGGAAIILTCFLVILRNADEVLRRMRVADA
jgi:hypothetical protein